MSTPFQLFKSSVQGAFIKLQAAFVGVVQTGHGNITGNFRAGTRLIHGAGIMADRSDNTYPTGAVDLQSVRADDTQGARGEYSGVLSGQNNKAALDRDLVVGGKDNYAHSAYGYATVLSGQDNEAAGGGSVAMGIGAAKAWIDNQVVVGLGAAGFPKSGYMQGSKYFVKARTTNASTTNLTTDGLTPVLPAVAAKNFPAYNQGDKVFAMSITVLAKQEGSANSKLVRVEGILSTVGGIAAGTWAQLSGSSINNGGSSASWGVGIGANDTTYGAGMLINVTGVAATNINWVARIDAIEIGI